MNRTIRIFVCLCAAFVSTALFAADDAAPETSSQDAVSPEPSLMPTGREEHKIRTFYRERWENAFDLRSISIAQKNHYMIGAQWNRKASWGSMIGIGAIGTPTNITIRKEDPRTKDSYSFYAGGLFIGHQVFDFRPFRLIAFVNGGKGIVYHRSEAEGAVTKIGSAQFTYLDPGAYVTFFSRDSIDVGLSVSAFAVSYDDKEDQHAKKSDIGGATVGLTFRKLYH
jgi:hypothetical protein